VGTYSHLLFYLLLKQH